MSYCVESLVYVANCIKRIVVYIKHSQAPSTVAIRIVVVKFVRRSMRDDIYAARVKFATFNRSTSNKICINENLPPAKCLLFAELRKLANTKKILGIWS